MSYLGNRYDFQADVGTPNVGAPPEASAAQGAGMAGAMSGGNPYMMAGSFLINYMKAKEEAFQKKKQQEMQIQDNYAKDQDQAMQSLNNNWKSALLK